MCGLVEFHHPTSGVRNDVKHCKAIKTFPQNEGDAPSKSLTINFGYRDSQGHWSAKSLSEAGITNEEFYESALAVHRTLRHWIIAGVACLLELRKSFTVNTPGASGKIKERSRARSNSREAQLKLPRGDLAREQLRQTSKLLSDLILSQRCDAPKCTAVHCTELWSLMFLLDKI